MARNDSDNLTSFLLGLFCGVAGGALLGILFAPKSGDALREDMKDFVSHMPERVNNELTTQDSRTRKFIDKTRYNLENQVDRIKQDMKADRMARAKRAEELASGYEYH